MTHWETAHKETVDGFDIVLSITPEDMPPDWDETEEERAETLRKINDGTLAYFVARVEASKHGVLLATEYLGCCCYDSVERFVKDGDYYGDMRQNVVIDAKAMINKLQGE